MTGQPMREDDPMRESGARWCDVHGRWECSKKTKHGTDCHEIAIAGLDRGRMHGGRSSTVLKAIGEANLAAWSTAAAGEDAPVVDPSRAVMDQLRLAVMRADLLGLLVREQLQAEDEQGLVGKTHTAGVEGRRVETGEQVRALARLEVEWRDRVVRWAKTAHDMGIDARRLELEEAQAGQVVAAAGAGLDAAGLSPVQRDAFLAAFLAALGVSVDLVSPAAELEGGAA